MTYGTPRDSKAPHFPRISRGKLVVAKDEPPVVPESADVLHVLRGGWVVGHGHDPGVPGQKRVTR